MVSNVVPMHMAYGEAEV